MAESEQLDFIVRMLFPSADTTQAEAALKRLGDLAKSTQQTVAASTTAAVAAAGAPAVAAAAAIPMTGYGFNAPFTMSRGPGGGAVFSYPTPTVSFAPTRGAYAYPAGPGFSSGGSGINWANNAPGPGNWGMSGGSWSQGPIRDPSSWAGASFSTARGYDYAMMRDRVAQAQPYFAAAEDARGSISKAATGINQLGAALTNLAAGIVLTNKAAEQGADAWQNLQTKFVGGLNIAVGAGMGIRGAQNLVTGAGGLALRGVNLGAGMATMAGMGGTASVLGRLAAPLGMGGMIAGGLAVGGGAAAVGYLGYQLFQADQDNQEAQILSQQLEARRVAQREMMLYNRIGAPEQLARVGIGLDADANRMMNAAGAMSFRSYDRFLTGSINDLAGRNAGLRSKWMGGNASDEGMAAGRELSDNLELQIRLVEERGRKREQEKRTQIEQLNIERELTQVEQARAGSSLHGMRGVTDRDWRRGLRLITQAERNGLDERTAMGIAAIPGMGGRAAEWLDTRNQARIDALPPEWRSENSRSSQQLEEIKKRLKDAETENQQLLRSIGDNSKVTAGLIKDLRTELDKTNRELFQLKNNIVISKTF